MAREAIDRRQLLSLVTETKANFPPHDGANARSFRMISVDYLEGALTYQQFNLIYTNDKTPEQITDEILHMRESWMAPKPGYVDDMPLEKWRGLRRWKRLRRF